MKASALKTKTLSNATEAGLDAAIAAFTAGLTEEQFIAIQFQAAAGFFAAIIVYTL